MPGPVCTARDLNKSSTTSPVLINPSKAFNIPCILLACDLLYSAYWKHTWSLNRQTKSQQGAPTSENTTHQSRIIEQAVWTFLRSALHASPTSPPPHRKSFYSDREPGNVDSSPAETRITQADQALDVLKFNYLQNLRIPNTSDTPPPDMRTLKKPRPNAHRKSLMLTKKVK